MSCHFLWLLTLLLEIWLFLPVAYRCILCTRSRSLWISLILMQQRILALAMLLVLPDPSWCSTALRRRLTSIISEPPCLAVCHFTLYLSADPFSRVFSKRQMPSPSFEALDGFSHVVCQDLYRWKDDDQWALTPWSQKIYQKMAARNVNSQVRSTVSCIESGSLFVSLAQCHIPGFLYQFAVLEFAS